MPRVGYREIDRDFTAAAVTQSDSQPSEEHELGILETLGTVMRVRRDEALFQEGDAVPHYYKVVSGSLRSFFRMADATSAISFSPATSSASRHWDPTARRRKPSAMRPWCATTAARSTY